MPALARNADGDDLLFVHEGSADFHCDFGRLALEAGDYVMIPRGTMWRLEPASPLALLMIEASNSRAAEDRKASFSVRIVARRWRWLTSPMTSTWRSARP